MRRVILVSILIISAGCTEGTSSGSYAGILIVDDKEYYLHGDIKGRNFTPDEKIGEVQGKVKREVMPKSHLSSNYLSLGEKIFTSHEDEKVLIAEREDESLELFAESGYFEEE